MHVAIVGGGVTGLSVADELSNRGHQVTVYEADEMLGGLAGSFHVGGAYLEKFYHHLFTSDTAMAALIERLGLGDKLEWLPTSNSYYVDRIYRLSTPMDLMRFSHINLLDRLRLGMLYLRTTFVQDWRPLEAITAREWLVQMAGERVYDAVWRPLLRTKFGRYADDVAAVWIWNKLKLRGSSRGSKQEERLGYLREGFGQAIEAWERLLRDRGVTFILGTAVQRINPLAQGLEVRTAEGEQGFDAVVVTTAPSILARLTPDLPADYRVRLERIAYLGNVCLVMQLDRSLSDTYWLNIGDPAIPFTGVIEHTNMQRPETYGGAHLAYISRYLDVEDPAYGYSAEDLLSEYLPHLKRMFSGFQREWVQRLWAWRAAYAQPVIGTHYSDLRPPFRTPLPGLWLSSMAQVYPEDRGMNYAVVYGQKVVKEMLGDDPSSDDSSPAG